MDEDEGDDNANQSKQAKVVKKLKSKPDMAIRRKQLKAKSKAISTQIKKRKQIKKKRPLKK